MNVSLSLKHISQHFKRLKYRQIILLILVLWQIYEKMSHSSRGKLNWSLQYK